MDGQIRRPNGCGPDPLARLRQRFSGMSDVAALTVLAC